MTPAALTPAARKTSRKSSDQPVDGHPRALQHKVAPRRPRRVSGPARGIAGLAPRRAVPPSRSRTTGRAEVAPEAPRVAPDRSRVAPGRSRVAPERPRVKSTKPRVAPSRPRVAPRRPRVARAPAGVPLGARLAACVRALPDHSLLDRIIRGRVWIPLLGILLVGIVAMQVATLKLNAGVGRALQQGTVLQSQNEQLRASVAQLSDDQRIETVAARMGMVMPLPTRVKLLTSGGGSVTRALSGIHQPDVTGFDAAQAAAQAAAVAKATTVPAGTGDGTTSAASTAAPSSSSAASGATSTASGTSAATSVPVTGTTGTSASVTGTTGTSAPATGTAAATPATGTAAPTTGSTGTSATSSPAATAPAASSPSATGTTAADGGGGLSTASSGN